MMTFSLTLTPAVLSELTAKLSRLATDVTYRPGTPGVLSIDKYDPANETTIMDVLTDALPTVHDVPSWSELTKTQGKPQAAIAAKRQRQVGVGL